MARIPGVTTVKDTKGKPASITINLKKHPGAVPVLQGIGLIEKSDLRQEVEENPENFMTLEEFRHQGHEHIKATWAEWKKSQ